MKTNQQKPDAFSLVTDVVISHLEKGTVPWKESWTDKGLPINLKTCQPHGGLNLWLLNALEYKDNMFLTANQAKELGGRIRRDENPHLAIYWKWPKADTSGELPVEPAAKPIPRLSYYYLFNLAQCVDIPEHCVPGRAGRRKYYPLEVCKEVVTAMPNAPQIRNQGDKAYYQPVFDLVTIPSPEKFPHDEYYYATLFKQLVYSTQHQSRLNRKSAQNDAPKDVKVFSEEELAVEIATCYLCSFCGIDTWNFENRMEYIQGWIEKLKTDSRCIVYAAIHAQKAVEYILRENTSYAEDMKVEDRQFQTEAYE